MRTRWLMCVLLGALALGQAAPGTPPAKPAEQEAAKPGEPAKPAEPEVPMNAVVLTIKGVCPATPTAKPAAKTADGKAADTKAAPAKKPGECETKITRAQFEKIGNALSRGNMSPQLKRQLEQALPRFMAMSEIAKKKGEENTEYYKESIKIARMQILTTELQHTVQEQADKISNTDIDDYYKKNPEAFEQYSLDRLFIPRYKSVQPEEREKEAKEEQEEAKENKEPENLTAEQKKAKEEEEKAKQEKKEAEEKARQEEGEKELAALADKLRERAAAGEDFVTLQKEAFAAAGTKVENPTVNLPKVRRTGLPPAHAEVFDLKQGEVSKVISDNGGHYIYKVVTEEELPLDQVETEIHNKLKGERQKKMMDDYNNSFHAEPNEAYFGPPPAPGPMGPRGRPMMGRPPQGPGGPPPGAAQQSAPPAQNQPAAAPAQSTPPPSKPN